MAASTNGRDPFELLRDYESRSLRDSAAEAVPEDEGSIWTGIAYRLAGQDLVTLLSEIREVINPPSLTMVPGVNEWILGLANVHGTLLPVVDLRTWLGAGGQRTMTADTRVIVAQHEDTIVGIVVDGVLGMRNFRSQDEEQAGGGDDSFLAPYLTGAFGRSGRSWNVLSFEKLLSDPAFVGAAVAA